MTDNLANLKKNTDAIDIKVEQCYNGLGYELKVATEPNVLGVRGLKDHQTGGSICRADTELFVSLSRLMTPNAIYAVGNAFGLSTITLGFVFPNIPIDVIDAETEGPDNHKGSEITRELIKRNQMNIRLFTGFSPQDTYKCLRTYEYNFVFIDGLHTNEQLFKDFCGIYSRLAPKCIVVCHDVICCGLQNGIKAITNFDPNFTFCYHKSRNYPNAIGTGFLYRGFEPQLFREIV